MKPKTRTTDSKPVTEQHAPRTHPDRRGPLQAELMLIGSDLLKGTIDDGNARHLAGMISERGGHVHRITFVHDDEASITAALREALDRNPELVITTGGLGPAGDDRTLAAVASALGLPLTLSPPARDMVEAAYRRLHDEGLAAKSGLDLAREKMCHLPVGGTAIPNALGVAPGVLCRLAGGTAVLSLPGKPGEARAVLKDAIPLLRRLAHHGHVAQREIESPSADESSLRPIIDRLREEFPKLWITSRPVGSGRRGLRVLVTLEASAASVEEANSAVAGALHRLLALAGGSR